MSSGFGTKKGFLDRLQAQKDENQAKAIKGAEFAEASFKSILDKAKSLSDDIASLNDSNIKIYTFGVKQDNGGTHYVTVSFKKGYFDHPVTIRLNNRPDGRPEFVVSGLTDDSISSISAPRPIDGSPDFAVDTNQGFEIAQAMEDFAVKFFA